MITDQQPPPSNENLAPSPMFKTAYYTLDIPICAQIISKITDERPKNPDMNVKIIPDKFNFKFQAFNIIKIMW